MQRVGITTFSQGRAGNDDPDGRYLTDPRTGATPPASGPRLYGWHPNAARCCCMETETTVQIQKEPRLTEEDWAEAEWFLEWLRLARRDYQGDPLTLPEVRRAA